MTLSGNEPAYRLFFALWPSAAESAALAAWQSPLRELYGGRPMRADTLHATLVFLGNVPGHRLEALSLAAQETDFAEFTLNLTSAHYWGHNHIVYAAPAEVPRQLERLANGLTSSLRKHRFRVEDRPYKPHITLLRNAKWAGAERGADQPVLGHAEAPDMPPLPLVRWRMCRFALVKSLSDEEGARYEVLAWFGGSALE